MADLLIKPLTGAGNTVTIQDQAGGAILTSGNSGATLGSGITFPAGHVLQVVTGTGGDNSGITHNGATWTNLETLSPTITVTKGNKVLVIANSVGWFTTGSTNYNGQVRIRLTDGTNEGLSNSVLLWTQNYSITSGRMYGTSHSGLLTTATGSGTVVVTAYVQASTESLGTVNYGDTNTNHNFGYTLMEIQG